MATAVKVVQASFDYRDIAGDDRGRVKERAVMIHKEARRTAQGIVKIGQWLTEVKETLGHGQWLPWLKGEFGWSADSAERFMRVFELVKFRNLRNLNIDASALYLIAKPSTLEPVRREVVERAKRGEPITHAKAREVLQEYEKHEELPPPAVARQIAIALGESVAASNNLYIPPMSKEEESKQLQEQVKIRSLYNAFEMIAHAGVTPQEMAVLGGKHYCRQMREYCGRAIAWLILLQGEYAKWEEGGRQSIQDWRMEARKQDQ
jgi:hypothetical protein